MKPMECMAAFLFIGTMTALASAMKDDTSDILSESRFKDLQDFNRLKDLQALRSTILLGRLLGDLDQRLEPMQKRDCYFNAGLSHSCDNEDVLSALAEARHLGSFNSPGRRRRRKRQPTMVLPLDDPKGHSDEDLEINMIDTERYGSEEQEYDKGDGKKNKYLSFAISSSAKEEVKSEDHEPTDNHLDKLQLNVHSPKRTKRCLNLWDDSCANGEVPDSGSDGGYFEDGDNPGKRSLQKLGGNSIRCINLWDDSCANEDVPGSGSDGDYFGGGDSPGKRSLQKLRQHSGNPKRCINLWDDSCANEDVPGSGSDGDYFGGGDSPGKRSLQKFRQHSGNPKRCINLWDDSCANEEVPGSGSDDDYFGGGDSPGKRSLQKFRHHSGNPKRCLNLWDDSCVNGQVSGSGNDDGYFEDGHNPGKRALSQLKNMLWHAKLSKFKRCLYIWDDSCNNSDLIGAGDDDNYFGSPQAPVKRSLEKSKLRLYCSRFPGSGICRHMG